MTKKAFITLILWKRKKKQLVKQLLSGLTSDSYMVFLCPDNMSKKSYNGQNAICNLSMLELLKLFQANSVVLHGTQTIGEFHHK